MKNRNLNAALLLFVVVTVFVVACDFFDGDDQKGGWDLAGALMHDFVYTTFNVGLAPTFVPLADERLEPLKNAISEHEADAICLEEVWLPEYADAIRTAAEDMFPYSYSVPAEQKYTPEAPCTETEIQPIISCYESSCSSFLPIVDALCALGNCGGELGDLQVQKPGCAAALIAQVGKTLTELKDAVTNPSPLFAYDGSNGLLLLSRYPLSNTQLLDLKDKSTTNHRVVLFATVEIAGRQLALGCTHLTANLTGVPYTGQYSSWQEENYEQVAGMISFAETYADSQPIYLAGDFNCSFANETMGVDGDFEESCQQFLDAGYFDPGMDELGCSFCENNLLNIMKGGGEGNLLIDHVFVKHPLKTTSPEAEIVFDYDIEVETTEGTVDANLSDHYGVRVRTPVD